MWRTLMTAMLTTPLLAGCLLNGAYELHGDRDWTPADRAVIIFGARDDKFSDGPTGVTLRFNHYSLETGQITGTCFRWDRIEVGHPATPGVTQYYAFAAPPGPYVLMRELQNETGQSSQLAFHAPAGAVTYFGDFWEEGGEAPNWTGRIVRYVEPDAAAAFAASRGLAAPRLVKQTPLAEQPAGGFACTP